jgi:hypothetical protein
MALAEMGVHVDREDVARGVTEAAPDPENAAAGGQVEDRRKRGEARQEAVRI